MEDGSKSITIIDKIKAPMTMVMRLLAQYFPGLGEHYAMNRYYEQAISMY